MQYNYVVKLYGSALLTDRSQLRPSLYWLVHIKYNESTLAQHCNQQCLVECYYMLYSFANLAYMTVLSPYEWQVYLITYCTCDALGLWASLHHGKPLLSIAPTRVCQGSRFHRWQYIVVSFISKLTKNNVYNTYSKSKINCNYKLLFFFLNYTFFESSLLFFVTKGWHLWVIHYFMWNLYTLTRLHNSYKHIFIEK